MLCEECQGKMQWRSTNTVTHLSKFKCPNCGHVQLAVVEFNPKDSKVKPRYYYEKDGKWIVRRKHDHQHKYVGTYANEETARKVVEKMNACDWDLDEIPRIYNELGIHRVNYTWVCV